MEAPSHEPLRKTTCGHFVIHPLPPQLGQLFWLPHVMHSLHRVPLPVPPHSEQFPEP